MASSVKIRPRLPGWAGVTLAIMMVAGFVLDMGIFLSTGAEPAIRLGRLGPDLVRVQGSAIWPVEAWIYTLMVLPASLFALGAYWLLREDGDEALLVIGLMATLTFWAIHTAHNVAILTVVVGLAPAYVPGAAEAPAIEATARGFVAGSEILFRPGGGLGTLFQAVASLAFGKALLQPRAFPRWLGYAALGSGLFALLGLLQYAFPPLIALGLLGWILFIAWTVGVSVNLVRGRREGTGLPRRQEKGAQKGPIGPAESPGR